MKTPLCTILSLLWVALLAFASSAMANEVIQWNETTMKAIVANGQSNLVSTLLAAGEELVARRAAAR